MRDACGMGFWIFSVLHFRWQELQTFFGMIGQDEERLDFARSEVAVLRQAAEEAHPRRFACFELLA